MSAGEGLTTQEMPTGEPIQEAPEAATLQLSFSQVKQFEFTWSAATGAEYYQLLERPTKDGDYGQIGENIVGESISLTMPLHFRFGASYVLRACNGGGCAESEPVDGVGSMAAAVGYFKASNSDTDDQFGASVALSADGSTLVVGAAHESSGTTGIDGDQADDSVTEAGAVYVFVRSSDGWSQQAYIKPTNTGAVDYFGASVAVSADGNTVAVGAPYEDSAATTVDGNQADNSADGAGAVYVFVRSNDAWSQAAYLKASNSDAGDYFGTSVSVANDGSTLAVGAPGENSAAKVIGGNQDDDAAGDAGAVYVFVRSNKVWSQQAYLKASNTDSGDEFGTRVAVSGDGNTLAVYAYSEDSGASGVGGNQADNSVDHPGAVYVFVRPKAEWSQEAYIKASNPDAGDGFGSSLAVSADGNTLAVGTVYESSAATGIDGNQADDSAAYAGAVYVFVRSEKAWSQEAYIKASNTDAGDRFGASVAVSADGNTLMIGADGEESPATGIEGDQANNSVGGAGAAYVFVRSSDIWSQRTYLKASNTDAGDVFGTSIAVSADGNIIAVGARYERSAATGIGGNQTDDSAEWAGAVYLF